MELEKQPETEMDFFLAIRKLRHDIFWTNHDIITGHLSFETEKQGLEESEKKLDDLIKELSKFGVIAPKDCPFEPNDENIYPSPPTGQDWYYTWYLRMNEIRMRNKYEKLICSACPYELGFDHFREDNQCRVSCTFVNVDLNWAKSPTQCRAISWNKIDYQGLCDRILKQFGSDALKRFEEKILALKDIKFDKEELY